MRRFLTFMLALVMLLSLVACGAGKKNEIMLGTSDFSIILPAGYEKTDDDLDEDQIAYYYKDDDSIDFDVYQWDKGNQYTLESEAEYYAAQYGTKAEPVVVNGINGMKYLSVEEYDGFSYTVVNYMFEDEDSIVELCFWTIDTDEEYAAVDEIIQTLKKK